MAKVNFFVSVNYFYLHVFLHVQLKGNLQRLIAEHNVDVSKLELTTQEHADTTNTFALMHKEIEQLRVEKYINIIIIMYKS